MYRHIHGRDNSRASIDRASFCGQCGFCFCGTEVKIGGNMRKLLTLVCFCLLSISATCQTTHSAALSWPTSPTAGATYNVLRSSTATGTFTTVQAGVTGLTFTDSGLAANTQFCYEVTASSQGAADSVPTNVVCGTTGKDQTAPPGTLVVIFK